MVPVDNELLLTSLRLDQPLHILHQPDKLSGRCDWYANSSDDPATPDYHSASRRHHPTSRGHQPSRYANLYSICRHELHPRPGCLSLHRYDLWDRRYQWDFG